ncbi:Putative membrane protein, partial [Salmonella enterica subsp. enterica serovar Minnesota str. A4-603]
RQRHSANRRAVSTMIIGTLPVVIPFFANVLYSQRDGRLSWRRLAPALALIGFGLLCVNIAELSQGLSDVSGWRYGSGIVLALISVACWAWYALRNARWLRENPDKHPMMWATAQALVTLPVSLIGYAAVCLWLSIQKPLFILPFGPHPALFIGLMIAIAVLCSWVGALCWNIASQKLPTVILGPLIVFETLAGLLYTFILRQEIPPFLTLSGIALLVAGVVIAVRAKPEKATVVPVTER